MQLDPPIHPMIHVESDRSIIEVSLNDIVTIVEHYNAISRELPAPDVEEYQILGVRVFAQYLARHLDARGKGIDPSFAELIISGVGEILEDASYTGAGIRECSKEQPESPSDPAPDHPQLGL